MPPRGAGGVQKKAAPSMKVRLSLQSVQLFADCVQLCGVTMQLPASAPIHSIVRLGILNT